MNIEMSTNETKALRLAQMCVAQEDVRYYLKGICLDFPRATQIKSETGTPTYRIPTIGTDGHIMTVAQIAWEVVGELPDSVVIIQAKPVATSSAKTTIVLPSEGPPRLSSFNSRGNELLIAGTLIDGVYPDYNRIVQGHKENTKDTGGVRTIGLDAKYLGLISKALGGKQALVRLDMTHESNMVQITPRESIGDVEIYLMPLRLEHA